MFSVTSINRMSLQGAEEGLRLGVGPQQEPGHRESLPKPWRQRQQQETPAPSHLRLCVLDSSALPVQEAVLGVDHLLGPASLLEGGFQLHGYILAHCGKERAQTL